MKLLKITSAVLMLASAGLQPAMAQQKTYNVGVAVYGLKAEFMQLWTNSLKDHPLVKNGTVKITVFDGNYDPVTQDKQFDTMIAQKVDGILFVPIDIQGGARDVAKATAAKIPVVGSNARVNSDQLVSYVGSNDLIAGEMEAESLMQSMGGKGNVVILEGPIGQSGQIERRKGNQAVLAKYKDVKVLEMKTANWSRPEAVVLMGTWLTAYPGKINGIIGQNDEMALGAIEAVKAKGIDPKTIPTVGIDGVNDAVRAVKAGNMVSVLQDATAQAQGSLDVLMRNIVGASYKPLAPMWAHYKQAGLAWGDGTAKSYSVPWTPITTKNADSMLAKD